MKIKTLLIFFFLILSTSSFADKSREEKIDLESLICAYQTADHYKDEFEFIRPLDKFKHCSVSCMIGAECDINSGLVIGIAKEIYDYFGGGNPEWGDLLANIIGLKISNERQVSSFEDCKRHCSSFY